MKVNLLLGNEEGYLEGYLNLDPFAKQGAKTVMGDPSKLDEYIEDGEIEELRCFGIATFFAGAHVGELLEHWSKKLAHGGKLIIADVDMIELMKSFLRGEIDFSSLSGTIYGSQQKGWDSRKTALSMTTVCDAAQAFGLEIIEKKFDGIIFIVTAERP